MVLFRGPVERLEVGELPPDTRPPERVTWATYHPRRGFSQDWYAYAGRWVFPGMPETLLYLHMGQELDEIYDEATRGPIPWELID